MRGSSVILISAYWMLSMVKLYLELKPSIKCVRRCVCGLHMPVYLSVFFILSTFPFSTMLIIVCSSQNIFFFVSWPTFLLVIFVQCWKQREKVEERKKNIEGKILISTRRIHKNHIHREYRQTVMLKANANRNGKRISRMKKGTEC